MSEASETKDRRLALNIVSMAKLKNCEKTGLQRFESLSRAMRAHAFEPQQVVAPGERHHDAEIHLQQTTHEQFKVDRQQVRKSYIPSSLDAR